MGESKKTDVIKCDLRQKHNRRETRTIHIGILYLYSVETDFNEKNDNHSLRLHNSLNKDMKVPCS